MNEIKNQLLGMLAHEHSKNQTQAIVNYVGFNVQRFDALVSIFLTGDYDMVRRASWPLSNATEKNPKLTKKYLKKIFKYISDPRQHPAVKRHTLRIFELAEIPEEFHGELMDECINNILNPSEAVAVQAYSLGILQKLTTQYSEIKNEVVTIIESRMPNASPAFKTRAKKYLKATAKL